MLKGAEWPAIAQETSMLGLFVAAYAGFALLRFRRTLD
jgi:ABC-2 type transport system permease protein